jgi:hypothetical protein
MKTRVVKMAAIAMAFAATATGLSSVANAQDPIKRGNLGTGIVFGVNKPGDAKFKTLKPDFGDKLETSIYAPKDDTNKDLGLVKGNKYTMLMLTGKDKQQAFIYWETPDPNFQDILLGQSTKLDSKGDGLDLQRGDKVTIQAQRDKNLINITFTITRGNKGVGTFSFNVPGKKK